MLLLLQSWVLRRNDLSGCGWTSWTDKLLCTWFVTFLQSKLQSKAKLENLDLKSGWKVLSHLECQNWPNGKPLFFIFPTTQSSFLANKNERITLTLKFERRQEDACLIQISNVGRKQMSNIVWKQTWIRNKFQTWVRNKFQTLVGNKFQRLVGNIKFDKLCECTSHLLLLCCTLSFSHSAPWLWLETTAL